MCFCYPKQNNQSESRQPILLLHTKKDYESYQNDHSKKVIKFKESPEGQTWGFRNSNQFQQMKGNSLEIFYSLNKEKGTLELPGLLEESIKQQVYQACKKKTHKIIFIEEPLNIPQSVKKSMFDIIIQGVITAKKVIWTQQNQTSETVADDAQKLARSRNHPGNIKSVDQVKVIIHWLGIPETQAEKRKSAILKGL